jgi:hypothetical protein
MDQDEFDALFDGLTEDDKFLRMVSYGIGRVNAGYECGWTPHQTRRRCSDKEFAVLVRDAEEMLAERFEHALYKRAMAGNVPALQMVLYSKHKERGWTPPAQKVLHEGSGKIDINIVASVKEAVRASLDPSSVAALQGPIEEGEILEDD